jgi:outer membrane protein TolC
MIRIKTSFIQTTRILLLGTFGLLGALGSMGQTATLSPDELVDWIRKYHPVALQADLRIDQARSSVRMARGGFDPVLENETAQKTWNGRMYYYYNRPELKLPTWFGMSVHAGQEFLAGNETLSTDTKGESNYVGVSLSLAKNLLMDKRRAALRTAQVVREASEVEKRIALNDLIKGGLDAYWEWVRAFEQVALTQKIFSASEQRLNLVRTMYAQGDRPAMDTLEAWSQVQQLAGMLNEAELQWQTQRRELSNYLWAADMVAYLIPDTIQPDAASRRMQAAILSDEMAKTWVKELPQQNPVLQRFPFKLQELNIERKLKFQELLPDLRFQYNQLGKGYDYASTWKQPLFQNNFQYGLKLEMPLRLSMGRGAYQLAKQKIRETQLDQTWKQWNLENKLQNRILESSALQKQIDWQESATRGFEQLMSIEMLRFQQGESSLFLVNTREVRWLESSSKLLQLKMKSKQTRVAIDQLMGNLF